MSSKPVTRATGSPGLGASLDSGASLRPVQQGSQKAPLAVRTNPFPSKPQCRRSGRRRSAWNRLRPKYRPCWESTPWAINTGGGGSGPHYAPDSRGLSSQAGEVRKSRVRRAPRCRRAVAAARSPKPRREGSTPSTGAPGCWRFVPDSVGDLGLSRCPPIGRLHQVSSVVKLGSTMSGVND